ncbi:hypothetical protein GCM10007301_08690 [Azorhizobium oxalatiphilum]|uniref:Uncharacterized protein n=1 Tax=Azorhizobium oxalatiphilum TaxID=980631 RepID=A0A917BPU5_9HYPH|nr:hypothetical protein [Azorhizobium oxalatiphilum]GGF51497.1 hypothetical protein GCM10007301_08690 [Azorhizobium oxalatiphilum]
MTRLTNILAIASTSVLLATSTAFAGPSIGPENEVQYIVSAHERLVPQPGRTLTAPAIAAPHFDPHWGPAFDPSVN